LALSRTFCTAGQQQPDKHTDNADDYEQLNKRESASQPRTETVDLRPHNTTSGKQAKEMKGELLRHACDYLNVSAPIFPQNFSESYTKKLLQVLWGRF
jgi:hypothetical protein